MNYLSYSFTVFLLAGLILYYVFPKKSQWIILLVLSILFYISWGGYDFIYVGITVFLTWQGGKLIEKNRKNEKKSIIILFICSFANIIILMSVKSIYAYGKGNFILPLGIAFYTLMSIGYMIDVRRGMAEAEKNIARLALYLTYFPHILIGPISRYTDVKNQFFTQKKLEADNIEYGIKRMVWGAFKKLVVANRIMPVVSELTSKPDIYKGGFVLAVMFLYSIELYADFSGGIDLAIGISRLFGIKLQENFHRPYFSKSLDEYWRRWHISMSSWFRDYVFYPLSTCELMQNISRRLRETSRKLSRKVPVYLSMIVVWLATALWHGVTLNFLLWGMFNCLLLILFHEWEEKHPPKDYFGREYIAIFVTFFITSALKLFDCYEGFGALVSFSTIFTTFNYNQIFDGGLIVAGVGIYDYVILAIGCVMMFVSSLFAVNVSISDRIDKLPLFGRIILWGVLLIFTVVFGVYGIGYEKADFIYNRF